MQAPPESPDDTLEVETSLLSPVKRQRIRRNLLSNSVSEMTFRTPFSPIIKSTISAPLVNHEGEGEMSVKSRDPAIKMSLSERARSNSIASYLCMGDPGSVDGTNRSNRFGDMLVTENPKTHITIRVVGFCQIS